jgi:hypothetical protein
MRQVKAAPQESARERASQAGHMFQPRARRMMRRSRRRKTHDTNGNSPHPTLSLGGERERNGMIAAGRETRRALPNGKGVRSLDGQGSGPRWFND